MKRALTTKVFTSLTILFILIAAFSFAAFETKAICGEAKKCSQVNPSKSGEMLWDSFSRRFISLVSAN